jgi:hypothetical protein
MTPGPVSPEWRATRKEGEMPKLILKATPFEEMVAMVGANGVHLINKVVPIEGREPLEKHIELDKQQMLKLYIAINDQVTGR